jgi:RpiB/LacA/LacB family sugar-phosphate isomerase
MKPIGLAADHAGFALKETLAQALRDSAQEVIDFGATTLREEDDYPDYVIPLARAVASGELARGIVICGSGVGACVAANKVPGVRASICHDVYSAHQGVEHDDMNVLVLGARVVGPAVALELARAFLSAAFTPAPRHQRRLDKISALERSGPGDERGARGR